MQACQTGSKLSLIIEMITREHALATLRLALGDSTVNFRDGQWEAIDGVLNNRRQLVVQRTGWGKSMIYFLAAKFLREEGRGMTLLVSPLLALMRNQVESAHRMGIVCCTINSENKEEWDEIEKDVVSGKADLLLISPERLNNEGFNRRVLDEIRDDIGLVVVDEAHCISDWGHDFRPDYKGISRLLKGNLPVLATTATANNRVVEDIKAQLGKNVVAFRGDLVRKSLYLQNICLKSQEQRLAWLAKTLKERIKGSGIIYALTIRDARLVARWLRKNGIEAYAYSGGNDPLIPEDMSEDLKKEFSRSGKSDREFLENLLLDNRIKALVATSALGMGFDKPDLGFVIHYQRPKSVIDYYQQVGRAGRGVDFAYGVLMRGREDGEIANYFIRNAFPKEEYVRKILEKIKDSPDGLSLPELQKAVNLRKVKDVLKFVMSDSPSPIVKNKSRYCKTPSFHRYQFPEENIRRLTEIRDREQERMDEYVNADACLMNFLCEELESPHCEAQCGNCYRCEPGKALPTEVDVELEQVASEFLNHAYLPITTRKKWANPQRAETVFETDGKTNIPDELMMREGRALSVYNTGKFGRLVKQGKYETHRFDDCLVEACVKMLKEWSPEPSPAWVAAIPSLRDAQLVADFAARLARKLGLPYVPCLKKIKNTAPQKEMENSQFQQENLIDAFCVEGKILPGNCLLIDDMVDSKWTLTIATAVLRKAGVEMVTPLVLADSSNRDS